MFRFAVVLVLATSLVGCYAGVKEAVLTASESYDDCSKMKQGFELYYRQEPAKRSEDGSVSGGVILTFGCDALVRAKIEKQLKARSSESEAE